MRLITAGPQTVVTNDQTQDDGLFSGPARAQACPWGQVQKRRGTGPKSAKLNDLIKWMLVRPAKNTSRPLEGTAFVSRICPGDRTRKTTLYVLTF
jgi:hypothetical protein